MTKTPDQMLKELGKPFPGSAIKKREGGGGRFFDYIEGHTCINRLNAATNGEWSFVIRDTQWRDDLLIVHGELTIPGLGTRSGFGVQKVSPRGGEDLVKGAGTDSLKKCASQFGVALELYGDDYEEAEKPLDDEMFMDLASSAGSDGESWKRLIANAGSDIGRWQLLIDNAPSDQYRERLTGLMTQHTKEDNEHGI